MTNENTGVETSDSRTSDTTPVVSYMNGYTSRNKTYIVELTEDSFYLIGQALHILKISEPNNVLLSSIISDLNNQTNCVGLLPINHKVYEKVFDSPPAAHILTEASYIPFDRGK